MVQKKCNKTRLFFNLEGQMLLLQIIIIIFFYIFLILYIVRASETGVKPLASFPGLFRSECKQMLFFLDKVHLYSGTCLIRHTKETGKCVGL
jgi:dolichyl-phosphate-mannose--protein O-mannosyl transferase